MLPSALYALFTGDAFAALSLGLAPFLSLDLASFLSLGLAPFLSLPGEPMLYVIIGAVVLVILVVFLFVRRTLTGFREGVDRGRR